MTSTEDEDPYIQIAKLHSANLQAAEYGLALIDEKKVLELQHKELENEHDLLKLECEQLKAQLKTLQANKREETLKGETNEETLLHEKQIREKYLMAEIAHHEHELRSLKHDNERLHSENEKMILNCQELTDRIHELDESKVKLKYDLKEMKAQEQRLIDANAELEEDNVALQQQVQKLKENLIDFDGLKLENKQLQENVCYKNNKKKNSYSITLLPVIYHTLSSIRELDIYDNKDKINIHRNDSQHTVHLCKVLIGTCSIEKCLKFFKVEM